MTPTYTDVTTAHALAYTAQREAEKVQRWLDRLLARAAALEEACHNEDADRLLACAESAHTYALLLAGPSVMVSLERRLEEYATDLMRRLEAERNAERQEASTA